MDIKNPSRASHYRAGFNERKQRFKQRLFTSNFSITLFEDRSVDFAPLLPFETFVQSLFQSGRNILGKQRGNRKSNGTRIGSKDIRITAPSACHDRQLPRHRFSKDKPE